MSISSISSQGLYQNYRQLASGKRINSAADDAAGLAIAEKMLTQSNGYDVGWRNAATSQDMVNVADGGLSTITDSLQRIRELGVQASNTAIYGDSERKMMQQEIDQLKDTISDAAKNTRFNTMSLLDGKMGSSMDINMPNATLEALGIADFDVTGDFDLSVIDDAIDKVSSARGEMGATYNRLGYTMNYNSYASLNTTAARSRIEDLDFPKAISDMKKNSLLEEYRLMMQKKREEQDSMVVNLLRFNS